MNRIRILTVAKKEFSDIVTSRKFVVFLVIYLLFFGFSLYQGASRFTQEFMYYSAGMGEKPTFITIFGIFTTGTISFIGGLFGLLMGFDMLTREKETGTLKTLLSHPVFRDEIINGKGLAALVAMALIVAMTIVVALGVLMIAGFTPEVEDLLQIAEFSIITLAYLFTFFSIGLFASAVSKTTTTSLLIAFGLFFFFSIVMPTLSFVASSMLVGEPPKPPDVKMSSTTSENPSVINITEDPRWQEYKKQIEEYSRKMAAVKTTFDLLSPSSNYITLVNSLSGRSLYVPYPAQDTTKNWIGMFVTPVIFFALSYVRFLREELT